MADLSALPPDAVEARRHECEVLHVARMPTHRERRAHLDGVRTKRSPAEAERLRRDVWALMQTGNLPR